MVIYIPMFYLTIICTTTVEMKAEGGKEGRKEGRKEGKGEEEEGNKN